MAFKASPLFPGDLFDTSLRLAGRPERPDESKWTQMLALGWQGVILPEAVGGAEGTIADLAAIVEAAARHAVTAPIIDRCGVAPALLSGAAASPALHWLLEAMATGEASVAAVADASARVPGTSSPCRLEGTRASGRLPGMDLSEPATHVLFNTTRAGEPVLVLLPPDAWQPRARRHRGIDGRVCADLDLDGLAVAPEQILLRGEDVIASAMRAQQIGSLLDVVQAVGAAGAMIEQTIEYLGTRVQFGAALATFQALRHRVVEMYVAYENTSGMVRRLVEQASLASPGSAREIALVKLHVARSSRRWSESAIQLHGGMGMSWEMPVARLAMHSLAGSLCHGSDSQCLDWLSAQALEAA